MQPLYALALLLIIDVATPNGDVDFEAVKSKAYCVTPVPGGVGPMTITMLLQNVLAAHAAILGYSEDIV